MSEAERCPRCGQANRCAQAGHEQAVSDCWCFHMPVDARVLDELPAELRGKVCLCPACAAATDPRKPD